MKIALMCHPWAAAPEYTISADSLHQWTAAIACIYHPTLKRFSAALYIGDDPRPHPVQRFHGVTWWPESVVSGDSFLVVRTGLSGAKLASDQWQCLMEFPDHLRQYNAFFGDVSSLVRESVYGGPKLVET